MHPTTMLTFSKFCKMQRIDSEEERYHNEMISSIRDHQNLVDKIVPWPWKTSQKTTTTKKKAFQESDRIDFWTVMPSSVTWMVDIAAAMTAVATGQDTF
jgi:hypothetical protein